MGVCLLCSSEISNCATCSDDGLKCLTCEPTYYLFSLQNNGINNACVSCNEDNQYKKTEPANGNSGQCDICSNAIDRCLNCRGNSNKCERCESGFSLWNADSNTADFELCVTCTSATLFKSGSPAVCQACSSALLNCHTCSPDGTTCLTCLEGQYLFKSNENGVFDSCIACEEATQYISGLNCNRCTQFNSDCVECRGDTATCSKCRSGLYLWDNNNDRITETCDDCSADGRVRTGQSDGSGVCRRCNYFVTGCTKCSSDGSSCLECDGGNYPFRSVSGAANNDLCFACDHPSTLIDSGSCFHCSEKIPACDVCNGDPVTNGCLRCQSNFFLFKSSESLPIYDQCVPCTGTDKVKVGANTGHGMCQRCSVRFDGCQDCNINQCTTCSGVLKLYLLENGVFNDDCNPCTAQTVYVQSG